MHPASVKRLKVVLVILAIIVILTYITTNGYTALGQADLCFAFSGYQCVYLPVIERRLVDTPTPTKTLVPTPTLTSTPTPTQVPPSVRVLSSTAFNPYEGSNDLYIVGEVLNNTASNVEFVRINATLRDLSGNVVDSDYTYSDIGILTPGMKSPFNVIFFDPPQWATYDLVVTWSTTSSYPYPLELLNSTFYFDSYDAFHVAGEIRNQYSVDRTYVEAYLTLYDASGTVIGVGSAFTNPYDLTPGLTASFDVEVYPWAGKPDRSRVASLQLQVLDD